MKKVAVIGAGASGLTAIKCCLDEGLEPVCFERSTYIGGLWHYTDDVEEGQACVMKSTVINTSKEMMCYSDFPIPGEFPNYMHNKCVDQYFHMYADRFELMKYINFNTEVLSVKQSISYETDGRWEITIRTSEKKEEKRVFDGVLVCSGHHADKNIPAFPGLDKFKGKVTHTHDYKDYHGYEDKRVLIIGIGNSGGDVATELSRISSQVYLSTRSGSWLFHRVGDNGVPGDLIFNRRINAELIRMFPRAMSSLTAKNLNNRFDHEKYSLKPKHGIFSAHPTISDELPNRIISGSIIVKANVAEFTETGAVFEDGSKVDNLDAVVLATGYIFGFPFLDKSIIEVKENKVNLFKYMFPPDLKKNTLAIIGCFQPLGAIMPLSEMQCRLATRVFKDFHNRERSNILLLIQSNLSTKTTKGMTTKWSQEAGGLCSEVKLFFKMGVTNLPNCAEMWQDIRAKQEAMAFRYKKSTRHTIQVDYVTFMDELAEIVGCRPNIKKLFLTDPKLAKECFFGPCSPYQYRLMGPGAWTGARQAILTQWQRIYQPLQTRPCDAQSDASFGKLYIIIALVLAVLLYFVL